MIGSKLYKIGVLIGGRLDPSLFTAIRTAQSQVATLGQGIRRDMNDAIAGPRMGMQRFFGGELYGQMTRAAIGLTAGMGFGVKTALDYGREMFNVGVITEATAGQMKDLDQKLHDISSIDRTNKSITELAGAVRLLVTEGFNLKEASDFIEPLARVATATGSEIDDVARTGFQLLKAYGVGAEEVKSTFDALLYAGKQGAFELKDMAQYFPQFGAAAQRMGLQGKEAAVSMGAMAQIVRRSSANSAEAAVSLVAAMDKIMEPRALKALSKKFNVNMEAVIKTAKIRGDNPLEAAMETLMQATGGDSFRVNEVIGYRIAKSGITALMRWWDDYKAIKEGALGSEGLIDKDYMKFTGGYVGTVKAWGNEIQAFFNAVGVALFPVLRDSLAIATPLLRGFINMSRTLPWLTAGLMGVTVAFAGLVLLAPQVLAFVQLFTVGFKFLAGGKLLAMIAKMVPLFLSVGKVLLALATGPIGLTALAIIGIGAALVLAYTKCEWFRDAVNAAAGKIAEWWGRKMAAMQTAWEGLMETFGGLFQLFRGVMNNDADDIKSGWETMCGGLEKVFKGSLDWMAADWKDWTKEIDRWMEERPAKLREMFDKILQQVFKLQFDIAAIFKGNASQETVENVLDNQFLNSLPTVGDWMRNAKMFRAFLERYKTIMGLVESNESAPGPASLAPPTPGRGLSLFDGGDRPWWDEERAFGGHVMPGVRYLLGEHGPEIAEFGSSGRVIPAAETARQLMAVARHGGQAPATAAQPLQAPSAGVTRQMIVQIAEGAIQVNAQGGSSMEVEKAVRAALEDFRLDLEANYRALLND